MSQLVLEPIAPGPGLAALLALGLVLLGLQQRRERPGVPRFVRRWAGACWVVAFLGCVGLLANPTWLETIEPGGGTRRVILIDTSRSMNTKDSGARTRLEVARELAGQLAADPGVEISLVAFDETARPVPAALVAGLPAAGARTDLASALRAALTFARGGRLDVVLISDGADTGAGGIDAVLREAREARMRGVAVIAVPLGGPVVTPDVALELESSEEVGLVGEELELPLRVRQRGCDGRPATVELVRDGKVLAAKSAPLPSSGVLAATLPVPALPAGVHQLEVRVGALPGETVVLNNARALALHVLEEPVRVLVVEGKPYWDLPFLVREVAARRGIAVTVMVRIAPSRVLVRTASPTASATPTASTAPVAPVAPEELRVSAHVDLSRSLGPRGLTPYDVLVLGRDAEAFLEGDALELLRAWLSRRGGSLVCARGRPTLDDRSALARVLPFRWDTGLAERFRVQLTPEGRSLRLLPDSLESAFLEAGGAATGERVVATSALASVIARAGAGAIEGMPVIATQPYGLGRVVSVEGSGRWRTALRHAPADPARVAHRAFWTGLIRWLVTSGHTLPGVDIAIRAERSPLPAGEPVRLLIRTRDTARFAPGSPPRVSIAAPVPRVIEAAQVGGEQGLYLVDAGPLPAGRHECRVEQGTEKGSVPFSARCVVQVEPPFAEDLDRSARPDLLARIARDTGGDVVDLPDAARAREACGQAWSVAHPVQHRRTPAWDRPVVLLVIVAAWATGWLLRRREGLT